MDRRSLAAVLTTSAFLPQAYRTLRTAQTRDISFWTQFLLFTGNALWLLYGLYLGSGADHRELHRHSADRGVLFMKIRHG